MLAAMAIGGGISLVNILFNCARWLATFAFAMVALWQPAGWAQGRGGPELPGPHALHWSGLVHPDLLGSSLIFIFIEKLFAHRKTSLSSAPSGRRTFHHFIVNHMVVGFVLLATNLIVHKFFGWAANDGIRGWVQG